MEYKKVGKFKRPLISQNGLDPCIVSGIGPKVTPFCVNGDVHEIMIKNGIGINSWTCPLTLFLIMNDHLDISMII